MPVHIRLNDNELAFYDEALKKADIGNNRKGHQIELQSGDYEDILEAVKAAKSKSVNIKTKSITHMERIYHLQNVIKRIEEQRQYFPSNDEEVPEEAFIVEYSSAKEEEDYVPADEVINADEEAPELTDEWFATATAHKGEDKEAA